MPLLVAFSIAFAVAHQVDKADRCAQLMAPRNQLVERLVRALNQRDERRLWETFVSEVGTPGNRAFLLHFGPKDRDLQGIAPSARSALSTMAFRVSGLQQSENLRNVRIIRRDELGMVVRVEWSGKVRFPNPFGYVVEELGMAETDRRMDSEARRALQGDWYARVGPALFNDVRVRMDVRMNTAANGVEYVEAVVMDAQMKGPNGWFTIGSGTDR